MNIEETEIMNLLADQPDPSVQFDVHAKSLFMAAPILARTIRCGLKAFRDFDLETIEEEFIQAVSIHWQDEEGQVHFFNQLNSEVYNQFMMHEKSKKQVRRNDLHFILPFPIKDAKGNWKRADNLLIDFSIELQRTDGRNRIERAEEYISGKIADYDARRSAKVIQKVSLLWILMNQEKSPWVHETVDTVVYRESRQTGRQEKAEEGKAEVTELYLGNDPDFDNVDKDIEFFEVLFSISMTRREKENYMNERGVHLDQRYFNSMYILPTIVDDFQEEKRLYAEEAAEKAAEKAAKNSRRDALCETAVRMLKKGMNPELTAEISGLELEEVLTLQKKMEDLKV